MFVRLARAGAFAGLLVAATIAPAHAGAVSFDGNRVLYADPEGRANQLTVTLDRSAIGARVSLREAEPITVAGPGCAVGPDGVGCGGPEMPAALVVFVGPGDDSLELASSQVEATAVQAFGGPGNDAIRKAQTSASIDGGLGDDVIEPDVALPGATETAVTPQDVVAGNVGVDTVSYRDAPRPVTVSLDGVADDGRTGAGEGDNVLTDVERLVGSAGGDVLTGNDGPNLLDGGAGDDVVVAGAGRDDLVGGAGNDVVHALDGEADRISCGTGADLVYVDAADTVTGSGDDRCEDLVRAPRVAARGRLVEREVLVRLRCRGATTACRGAGRLEIRREGRTVRAGQVRYSVRVGSTETVRIRVTRRAQRLLARRGSTPATLVVVPRGSVSAVESSLFVRR